jgi:hypothetical protein
MVLKADASSLLVPEASRWTALRPSRIELKQLRASGKCCVGAAGARQSHEPFCIDALKKH